jgi:FkbM family methyltransferase
MAEIADERVESGGRHMARRFAAVPDNRQSAALLGEILAAMPAIPATRPEKPLALYGAGNLGRMARDFLQAIWLDFDFVVDRNAETLRQSPDWQGMTLYHPDEVPAALKQSHLLLVSVVQAPYVPIETDLAVRGFAHVMPFYDFAENFRHIHPLSNGWFAGALDATGRAMAARVLEGWGDNISRAHHLAFLAWRRLRQEWTFEAAPVTIDDRFFIPEILAALHPHEVFLDGGAHVGSVIRKFDQVTNGGWDRIVAVEPDTANRRTLSALIVETWPKVGRRPEILDIALGAAPGTALFHGGLGYASQVSATGMAEVEIQPIDMLDVTPSFMKLHLEGYELEALKGASRTLLRHRPIIVATVYHNDDGIWRTPLWLMRTLANYRLLFRIHSYCGTSAVIYAIPAERIR